MFSLFGLFLAVGFFSGSFIIWKKAKDEALKEEKVFDGIIFVMLLGLLGARLDFIFHNFNEFGFNFLKWFWLTRYAGLNFNGGLLLGLLALYWFSRQLADWDFWPMADLAVFGLVAGQAIVKIGLFLFERDISEIIEAAWLIIIFYFLTKMERRYRLFKWYQDQKKKAEPGFLILFYLIFYYLGRLPLEIWRGHALYLSSLIFLGSLIVFYQRSGINFKKRQ